MSGPSPEDAHRMSGPRTVVFAGPSLRGIRLRNPAFAVRPPVRRGDLPALLAEDDPPDAVCLVDGYFHHALSVGHREILAALRAGVRVYGCSSLGALRAVELRDQGMAGHGWVYRRYLTEPGRGDDEVALVHSPEPPYEPRSDPLVNVEFAITRLVGAGLVPAWIGERLLAGQRDLFYPERDFTQAAAHYRRLTGAAATDSVVRLLRRGRALFDVKRLDALHLLRTLDARPAGTREGRTTPMKTETPDGVASAMAAVTWDDYAATDDGGRLPQVSAPPVIAALLRLLAPPPGARILEIGTGSGYSTAVLAELAGPTGLVRSVDIVPELIDRAAALLKSHDVANAELMAGDGRAGWPGGGPFDRVMAWATADLVPESWARQLAPDGVIVAPVRLLPQAACAATVRLRRTPGGDLIGEAVTGATFAPLDHAPRRSWSGPAEQADVVLEAGDEDEDEDEPPFWLSGHWLTEIAPDERRAIARAFLRDRSDVHSPVTDDENVQAFHAYLMAVNPAPLTTAFVPGLGMCVGAGSPAGVALVPTRQSGYFRCGSDDELRDLLGAWRAAGRPGFGELVPVVHPAESGYRITVELAREAR
ncbi:TfuA-like protein [Nonomuraea solani]|uniref:TfuA-like protein n=1 Tax=Nonomuraea solani TaxID=1144553 RepID=UPI0013569751|nr:TfuA-like protein [Nonomuraea solani]